MTRSVARCKNAGISSCPARTLLHDRQLCSMIMHITGIAAAAGVAGSGRTDELCES